MSRGGCKVTHGYCRITTRILQPAEGDIRPASHVAVSLPIAAAIELSTGSSTAAVVCFLAGVFIDVDHFLDFALNFSLREFPRFFQIMYENKLRKLYVFFHSYELIALLWFAVLFAPLGSTALGLAVGVTQHLLFDQIFNRVYPFTYFLSARALAGFRQDALVRIYDHKLTPIRAAYNLKVHS